MKGRDFRSSNRGSGAEGLENLAANPSHVLLEASTPQSQDQKSLPQQDSIPNLIMPPPGLFAMTGAVQVDHNPKVETDKIQEMSSKRSLPAKVKAVIPQSLQPGPHPRLIPCQV
jgi:hypothetical protein